MKKDLIIGIIIGLIAVAIWPVGTVSAQSCYEATVQSPTPFMGNNGEILKLSDGTYWEVKYAYEYLYAYYPEVIICPTTRKLYINSIDVWPVGTVSAQSCYEATVQSPTPFMGNNGEILKLSDGTYWEVKYAYEYLYAYSPSVIICPTDRKLYIDSIDVWPVNSTPITCTYALSPTISSLNSSSHTELVTVTTSSNCSWSATSNDTWITVIPTASGTGSGTVGYNVAANSSVARTGTVSIGGQTLTVSQGGNVGGCINLLVRRASGSHNTLQDSYNNAVNRDTIQSQAVIFSENLDFSQNISVALKGGYDCSFSTNDQKSTVDGTVTISNGTVTMDNIIIR
ncbi:MAG: BACON domain-containing protein [Syntrophales bacterium]